MSRTSNSLFAPLFMVGATVTLSALAAYREPDGAIAFLVAMLFLPIAWTVVEWRNRKRERTERCREDLASIRWSISAAGFLLLVPLIFTLMISYGVTEALGDDVEKRIMGVAFGLIFLLYGNSAPKRPVSLSEAGCSPAKLQAHGRLSGRVFMLTAIVYGLIWALAPIDYALPAAMTVLVSGVLVVIYATVKLYRKTD